MFLVSLQVQTRYFSPGITLRIKLDQIGNGAPARIEPAHNRENTDDIHIANRIRRAN